MPIKLRLDIGSKLKHLPLALHLNVALFLTNQKLFENMLLLICKSLFLTTTSTYLWIHLITKWKSK